MFASNTPINFIPSIGNRTAKVLYDLNIYTVGQLVNIPETILVELFGPSIKRIIQTLQIPEQHKFKSPKQHDKSLLLTKRNNKKNNQTNNSQVIFDNKFIAKKSTIKKPFLKRLQLAAKVMVLM